MICPADETIARFLDGGLDASAAAALREHLDGCSKCRVRVDADAAPPTRKADPFHVGSILVGKYRVVSVLGAGGMGAVVSAVHEELGQKVAIKVLHDESLKDSDSVKRFLREGRAAARLTSDHAVRIYDVDRLPDGAPFLVMEYLEGRDLSALQRERALGIDEAVGYVLQAIEAIKEAHAQNLIHRDIKPANLFLAKLSNGETRVKVLDFGLAKEIGLHKGVGSDLTTEHAFLGSPMFMSPEQVRDPRTVDARTDVWSLGTTLWQLITGQSPFSRSSVQATLAEVCTKKLPPASSVRPGVPRYIDDVIARCMHKDPEGRFASVEELAAALRDPQSRPHGEAAASMDTGISSPDTPRMPEKEKKAFLRTEPMPARPLPAALPPPPAMTPRSAPTFVRPQPPADAPRRPGPPVALAIVAALALLAIAALGAVQLLPRPSSDATTASPTVTSSAATLAAAPASSAAPPPAASVASASAVSSAPEPSSDAPSAAPSSSAAAGATASVVARKPTPPAVPKPPTTARRNPPSSPSTGRPPEKDPYDR